MLRQLWKAYTQWWWRREKESENTPLLLNTNKTSLNLWLLTFAGWLGVLTDLFYLAHFLAICVILSFSVSDHMCLDQTIAILLFHHLVSTILFCAHLRPPSKDSDASDDAVDDRAIVCFGAVKVFIVLLCIVISFRCDGTSYSLLSCIYVYLVGVCSSAFLFFLLSVIHCVASD